MIGDEIGKGEISHIGNKCTYNGTMPFKDGEKVIMMKISDLELICKAEMKVMKTWRVDMPEVLFGVEEGNNPMLCNMMEIRAKDRTYHKLFLDRFIYGTNFKDELWIRYVNVDVSLIEEGSE